MEKNDPGAIIIPFSGSFEQTLVDLADEEARAAHCEEVKCQRYVWFLLGTAKLRF